MVPGFLFVPAPHLVGVQRAVRLGEKLIQRPDDSEETIRNRLRVYQEQTAPLISYYKERGLLKTVNCEDSVEENFKKVLKAING